ncbi:MAG: arginase family protein [Oceanospirillaceae bacterium]
MPQTLNQPNQLSAIQPSDATFMNVPFMSVPIMNTPVTKATGQAKAIILGLPFDCGSDPARIGARFGPNSIRQQSRLISPFDGASNINPLTTLNVQDIGDVEVDLASIDKTYTLIEQAMDQVIQRAAVPISLGGDGSVALPQMRALAKTYPDLVVIHIDAHTDAYPLSEYSNATPFTHAVHERLIDPHNSFHVGRRGSHFVPNVVSYCKELGYNLIDMQELLSRGIDETFARIKAQIGNRAVYLCFDMDFFDPCVAPGVCSPTFGGATSREGLQLIRACEGLNIVAADINTISPPHDVSGVSALLAATVSYEILLLLAKKF